MMKEHNVEMELDLQKLLQAYLHKWWLILIYAVLAALITWVISANFITPLYKAKITVYVNNVRGEERLESVTNANLATSVRLVNTYISMIRSDTVLEEVARASNVNISAAQIRSAMSASQEGETELFNVTITHKDPILAAQIANAVAEVAPAKIAEYVEGSSTKIIDYARVPVNASSPDVKKNSILGGLIGGVVALLYITLRFLLDVRIKDEEDLTMIADLPVLAQIPAFVPEGAKRHGTYGKKKYEYQNHTNQANKNNKGAE